MGRQILQRAQRQSAKRQPNGGHKTAAYLHASSFEVEKTSARRGEIGAGLRLAKALSMLQLQTLRRLYTA